MVEKKKKHRHYRISRHTTELYPYLIYTHTYTQHLLQLLLPAITEYLTRMTQVPRRLFI